MFSYSNPLTNPVQTSKEKFGITTKKILENFPAHRTLLVVNFDKELPESFLKSVFGVQGEIRRVFGNSLARPVANSTTKQVYFNVLVFKDQPALLHCFDTEQFQATLVAKLTPNFQKMSALEKEELFAEYMRSLGDDLLLNQ